MGIEDKTLTCVECGVPFVFTASEQEFHQQKGFMNEPRRCQTCREKRRRDGRPGSGVRAMTRVTCAQCGGEAEVPFVPRGDKPVLCRTCFDRQRGGGGRR